MITWSLTNSTLRRVLLQASRGEDVDIILLQLWANVAEAEEAESDGE